MKKILISVIIPIYNVAPYLKKCLNSLKNQTFVEGVEVICIDDGSTDESGKIVDEYISEDFPIFRVIHTENRGQAAARNRGIEEAHGDWLMFADSDDWVEPKFCEIPYKAAIENDADLVVFQVNIIKGEIHNRNYNGPTGFVDEMTAQEYCRVYPCNKLYKRSLFQTIRYPEGRVYEDVATTYKIVHESKRILFLDDYLYNYVFLRKGSTTHNRSKKITEIVSLQQKKNIFS